VNKGVNLNLFGNVNRKIGWKLFGEYVERGKLAAFEFAATPRHVSETKFYRFGLTSHSSELQNRQL